jgi:hypothetical protein
MVGWDQFGFNKKRGGTRYTELVFSHPMGSMGHVLYSGALGAQNGDALFITQSLILLVTPFSWLTFLWWFTLKRYLCNTLHIVKAKEILKRLCGNQSWLMENCVVVGGGG